MLRSYPLSRGLLAGTLIVGALSGLAGRVHSDAGAASVAPSATLSVTWTPISGGAAVVISEIAWSGTAASADDEWIELANRTSYPIDLSGWTLRAHDGEPVILLKGTIPAHGFFLLERGDDTTLSNIRAGQTYQGRLSDTGERLFLYDRSRNLVDHANAFSDIWLAGSLSGHRSMERSDYLADKRASWGTHDGLVMNGLDAKGRPIHGSPGRSNSVLLATPTSTPSSGDLPDLRVVWMKIDFENPRCWPPGGSPLGLRITIFNAGQVGARSFVVSMENEQDSGERTVLELDARRYGSVFFRHPYWGSVLARAEADSTGLVRESYEGNNVLIQLVPIYTFTPPPPCDYPTGTPTPTPFHPPYGSQPAK